MAPEFVSDEANAIAYLHQRAEEIVREKIMYMDRPTRQLVIEVLLSAIRGIEEMMSRPTVRGHLDPNLRNPVVHEESSWNSILKRLGKQIKAACILADLALIDPAANVNETEALNHVKQTLRNIVDSISPASSLRPSSTDSNVSR